MRKNNEAEKFAEEILRSIDTIQPVEVDDFLFTRVQNRINTKLHRRQGQMRVFYRLSMALLLFIVLNGATYYFLTKTATRAGNDHAASGLSAFAEEYKMTQNSYNY